MLIMLSIPRRIDVSEFKKWYEISENHAHIKHIPDFALSTTNSILLHSLNNKQISPIFNCVTPENVSLA